MLVPVLLFIAGLILLIKGGDWFVDGAVGIAQKFHIPELLIGATVVSIGTTLPEVMVSSASAISGHGEMAFGNAVGSIICNTALIAAITATVRPSKIDKSALKLPTLFFFISAAFYCTVAYTSGYFSRGVGLILIAIFVLYMILSVRSVHSSPQSDTKKDTEQSSPIIKKVILLIIGAALIAIGADLLVDNGTLIAEGLGVPESVIAITFVALGTSLPELVTAITSLAKGHGALSLGNVIGANLFNLVFVSGISSALSPFSVPSGKLISGIMASLVIDIPVMLAVMAILTLPSLLRGKLSRTQGVILLTIYAVFCVSQFVI